MPFIKELHLGKYIYCFILIKCSFHIPKKSEWRHRSQDLLRSRIRKTRLLLEIAVKALATGNCQDNPVFNSSSQLHKWPWISMHIYDNCTHICYAFVWDLRFSRQWRYRLWYFGLCHRVSGFQNFRWTYLQIVST